MFSKRSCYKIIGKSQNYILLYTYILLLIQTFTADGGGPCLPSRNKVKFLYFFMIQKGNVQALSLQRLDFIIIVSVDYFILFHLCCCYFSSFCYLSTK